MLQHINATINRHCPTHISIALGGITSIEDLIESVQRTVVAKVFAVGAIGVRDAEVDGVAVDLVCFGESRVLM